VFDVEWNELLTLESTVGESVLDPDGVFVGDNVLLSVADGEIDEVTSMVSVCDADAVVVIETEACGVKV